MEAIQLHLPNGKPCGVFSCGQCRKVWGDRKTADGCCICIRCGLPLDPAEQKQCSNLDHKSCRDAEWARREREREERAEKVDGWDGWVFNEGGGGDNGYFESVDAYMEHVEEDLAAGDDRPDFVWIAKEVPFPKLNLGQILENLDESMGWEDASDALQGTDELGKAIDAFNAANFHLISYTGSSKRMARLDWAAWDAAVKP